MKIDCAFSQTDESGGDFRFEITMFTLFAVVLLTTVGLLIHPGSSTRRNLGLSTRNPAGGSGSVRAEAFDLSECVIPTETLMGGGPPKDGIPSLTDPERIPSDRAGYLSPDDRVIGVSIGNEVVAYPIRILNYHECVNDKVGNRSIAVTYCPLCDSAFVFDREVSGEILEFGISGLLLNSNVLLYDRQPRAEDESLWSQVAMKAVCGPAAADQSKLDLILSEVVTWKDWKTRHPKSEVLSPRTGHIRDYAKSPYYHYFLDDRLMFPVRDIGDIPMGSADSYRNKEPAIVIQTGGRTRIYPFEKVFAKADASGSVLDQIDSRPISLVIDKKAGTVRLENFEESAQPLSAAYTFWFAWRSLQEDYDVFR